MKIKIEKVQGFKNHDQYYYIYDTDNPITALGCLYPNMTLNNLGGYWSLTINYKGTNYQTELRLGKYDDWPFDELEPTLMTLIESYLTLIEK